MTPTINIESISSKFNTLTAFLEALNKSNCFLDALLIQETWLSDKQCEDDFIELYKIPGYHTIPLGRKCGRKSGVIIYLRDHFTYKLRPLYRDSIDWEGQFIDITEINKVKLQNKIT